ncbi:hypothetical protein GCM10023185_37460 [Hymenobacter saemangeumensis]|uniref:Gliding motility lipoprotein GldB n=1 Tax=Hymenobacter saemangeumensis TaxID=1084522 RepID=A0ABP8IQD5_9BACT
MLPLFTGLSLLLAACSDSEQGCRPDPAADAPAVKVNLQRLERPFFRLQSQQQALLFMNQHPVFARYYLQRQPGNEAALASALAEMATNKDLNKLKRETDAAFPDSAALAQDLGDMFRRVQHYFPDFRVPPAYTYISGLLGKDIYVSDTLLVMSLDWFAGPKASYRPDLPQYMLRRYTPAHLLPTLTQSVSSKYNRHELTANTMLDAMIHSGKALYFSSRMLPCTPDSLLLGFTTKEIIGVEANEGKIWGHFLEKNLLYSTTPFLVQKYVGERPNVPEIDRTCPGRVGQWVGLQIVRKYMEEHPKVTLPQLLAEKNAQRILTESHYRPKRN